MNRVRIFFLNILFHILRFIVESIIYIRWELYKYELIKHDIITSSLPKNDVYAGSYDNRSINILASHIKKKFDVYELILVDGTRLECADDHKVSVFGYMKLVADLKAGEFVNTKNGRIQVRSVKKKKYQTFMFDITINSDDHLYYTNNILSQNSIITGIFIVWYLTFNTEKNVMCVSKNKDKVTELGDKIAVILKGLPFYLKPGMITNNVMVKAFDSGCKLVLQTTTEDTGASFTIHLLYADEFALVPQEFVREFYRTIFPTLSSSKISRMIITSTPRGLNKFYEIYRDAIESKNYFNPIRVDWYEVEGRDEEWRRDQILQLGNEEDFNQEYGNQFLAGNSLLFRSEILKKIKRLQTKFVHRELEPFTDLSIDYEGLLTFHPEFDMDNLKNEACRFVWSIDLADGNGGDYTVINILQILPMSKKEITNLKIFSEEKDFFKLVQVGLFRSNKTALTDFAFLLYHLAIDIFMQETVKIIMEMNHEGNYVRHMVENLHGDDNEIEEDHLFIRFKYNMADEQSQATRVGLTQSSKTKSSATKIIKDKIKQNQLVLLEFMTIEEALSFAKNKNGEYESQTGNDDCMMTATNVVHYYDTVDFGEQIDELMQFVPEGFIEEMNLKLNIDRGKTSEDDDYADLIT